MIQVIASPYYLGHRQVGMGAGPVALLEGGLLEALRAGGHPVEADTLTVPEAPDHEIGASFAAIRTLSEAVAAATQASAFPLVLGGNCNVCLGMLGGLAPRRPGVVWFDAHGDFHSPETTGSGFFDGFPLHMLVGRSWTGLTGTVPGFRPVEEEAVLLAGTRDLDPGEDELVAASSLHLFPETAFRSAGPAGFERALEQVTPAPDGVYVHVDLDVLDRDQVPANPYSAPGGLAPATLAAALDAVGRRARVVGASLTCYSPEGDPEGKAREAAIEVIVRLASLPGMERVAA